MRQYTELDVLRPYSGHQAPTQQYNAKFHHLAAPRGMQHIFSIIVSVLSALLCLAAIEKTFWR